MLDEKETAEKIDGVIKSLFENKKLSVALLENGISNGTFFYNLEKYPEKLESYERAQRAKAETLVEEIVDISDNETDPQKARNRIDARKWYASKMQPKKYGERIDVNLQGVVDVRGALNEALSRSRTVSEIEATLSSDNESQKQLISAGSAPTETESADIKGLDELLE